MVTAPAAGRRGTGTSPVIPNSRNSQRITSLEQDFGKFGGPKVRRGLRGGRAPELLENNLEEDE